MRTHNLAKNEQGFTLLETMIAILVLSIGVLGLAALLGNGLVFLNGSQADFIAPVSYTHLDVYKRQA